MYDVGDIVRLKGGSPNLTVIAVAPPMITVGWFPYVERGSAVDLSTAVVHHKALQSVTVNNKRSRYDGVDGDIPF